MIYMTYKYTPPEYVFQRWKKLNPEYTIEFSLNSDCISFLQANFGSTVATTFNSIQRGMHKADLWRLCKLYINGGVYADVDLVPHVPINTLIQNGHTFYSCLAANRRCIFQAFIITPAKNPLILCCIMSFLHNKPYGSMNGPTFDMFNCIKRNTRTSNLVAEKKYSMDTVKIKVNIGSSRQNSKAIDLYNFPVDAKYRFELVKSKFSDTFDFQISGSNLIVRRTDENTGWGHDHSVTIVVDSKQSIYLFRETVPNRNIVTAFVSWNNKKILDSRDPNYWYAKRHNIKWQ